MAIDTNNKFRALQALSDGWVAITTPDPDDAFDEYDEMALVGGVYPFQFTVPVEIPADTISGWRATQFLSDGQISLRLPHPDDGFDEYGELAFVAGVYPFQYTATVGGGTSHQPLVVRAGDPVGTFSTLVHRIPLQ